MPRKSDAKQAMITAARELLESRGVGSTGMLDIVAAANAPRGSIYHHFPNGKDEVVLAAIEESAAQGEAAILRATRTARSPAEVVARVAKVFRHVPESADWARGCPVAAAVMEGSTQSAPVREAARRAMERWSHATALALVSTGVETDTAQAYGMSIVSALEGAILLSRAMQSAAPFDATEQLLLKAAETIQA